MDKKTRIIRGPQGNKMVIPKPASTFTQAEKEHIILVYLNGNCSKSEIWKKYTGKQDHGRMLVWMRKLGYHTDEIKSKKAKLKQKSAVMAPEKQTPSLPIDQKELPQAELQAKLKTLEKELELAKIKAEAYSMMIDIAEKEFQIPIRKK